MELVVYIAIMGIIVIVAGQAFSNSTKFRVRNQSMIEANEVAGNIAALIKDDIAQMGAKSAIEDAVGGIDKFSAVYPEVYMDPDNASDDKKDSSSFTLATNSLKFRRVRYDESGKYMSVEEVRWFLEGEVLKRSCWTVAKKAGLTLTTTDPCVKDKASDAIAVEIADGVTDFSVAPGKPMIANDDEQLFPPSDGTDFMLVPRFGETHYNYLTISNEGSKTTLTGFAQNFNKSENTVSDAYANPGETEINQLYVAEYTGAASFSATTWKEQCGKTTNKFTLTPKTSSKEAKATFYEISFTLGQPASGDKMSMFAPGRDYLAVGFRDAEGNRPAELEDFIFYPPTGMAAAAPKRTMRFSVSKEYKDLCIAFTFASYSPVTADGRLIIENFKFKELANVSYDFSGWNPETDIVEKKKVKAFKLSLHVKKNGEEGQSEEVILTPANGPRD